MRPSLNYLLRTEQIAKSRKESVLGVLVYDILSHESTYSFELLTNMRYFPIYRKKIMKIMILRFIHHTNLVKLKREAYVKLYRTALTTYLLH